MARYGGSSYGSRRAREHIAAADALERKYGLAFGYIKELFLTLENDRVRDLMWDYSNNYGASAGKYAYNSYWKWQLGEVKMSGQTVTRLFDLLPYHMTDQEKTELLKHLRDQSVKHLRNLDIHITLNHSGDTMAVAEQVMSKVEEIGKIQMPPSFTEVQNWISQSDTQALNLMISETETYLATQRLTELITHLATISRLRQLVAIGLRLKVSTRFTIPTANIEIRFSDKYWKQEEDMETDNDLIVRLQDMVLRDDVQNGKISFLDYAKRTLTAEEMERLRAFALTQGLQAEVVLEQLRVKTIAASSDIDKVIETASIIKEKGHSARVSSEHNTASGVTKIEIDNRKAGCATSVLFLFLLIIIPVMLGCGGGGSSNPNPTPSPSVSPSPIAANERITSLSPQSITDKFQFLLYTDGPNNTKYATFAEWFVSGTGFSTQDGTYVSHVESADGTIKGGNVTVDEIADNRMRISPHIPQALIPTELGQSIQVRVVVTKGGIPLPANAGSDIVTLIKPSTL